MQGIRFDGDVERFLLHPIRFTNGAAHAQHQCVHSYTENQDSATDLQTRCNAADGNAAFRRTFRDDWCSTSVILPLHEGSINDSSPPSRLAYGRGALLNMKMAYPKKREFFYPIR